MWLVLRACGSMFFKSRGLGCSTPQLCRLRGLGQPWGHSQGDELFVVEDQRNAICAAIFFGCYSELRVWPGGKQHDLDQHNTVALAFRNAGALDVWWPVYSLYKFLGLRLGGRRGPAHWWCRRCASLVAWLGALGLDLDHPFAPAVRKSKFSAIATRTTGEVDTHFATLESPAVGSQALFCILARWSGRLARLGAFSDAADQDAAKGLLATLCKDCGGLVLDLRLDEDATRFSRQHASGRFPAQLVMQEGGMVELGRFCNHVAESGCGAAMQRAILEGGRSLLPS